MLDGTDDKRCIHNEYVFPFQRDAKGIYSQWLRIFSDECKALIVQYNATESMGYSKNEVTQLLSHWSYVFFALTHRNAQQ